MSTVFHDPAAWLKQSTPVVNLRLPDDVYRTLTDLAAEEGKTVETALQDFLTMLARG